MVEINKPFHADHHEQLEEGQVQEIDGDGVKEPGREERAVELWMLLHKILYGSSGETDAVTDGGVAYCVDPNKY